MKINIVAVGKIKKKFIRVGIDDFLKRLSRYAKVNIIEVSDERIPSGASEADLDNLREREGDSILSQIPGDSYVIVLDGRGKMYTSEGLAKKIKNLMVRGQSELTFVIGGAVGLHQNVLDQANLVLSFSPLTFTHQMIRMFLLEQVYRSFRIIRGEPYHY